MADSPSTSPAASVFRVASTIVAGLVFVGVLIAVLNKPATYTEVYCQPNLPVTNDSTVRSLILEATDLSNALLPPINLDTAVQFAPADALNGDYAMVCFDDSKQYVTSINGVLTPKDD